MQVQLLPDNINDEAVIGRPIYNRSAILINASYLIRPDGTPTERASA